MSKLSKNYTQGQPLFTDRSILKLLLSTLIILAVLMANGCADDNGPRGSRPPTGPGGLPPTGPGSYGGYPGMNDPTCIQYGCALYNEYFNGNFYKTSYYGQGYESFLFINGQSYYVGNQSNFQVQQIMASLPPGWYSISLTGSVTFESGHYPLTYEYYPVIQVQQTY